LPGVVFLGVLTLLVGLYSPSFGARVERPDPAVGFFPGGGVDRHGFFSTAAVHERLAAKAADLALNGLSRLQQERLDGLRAPASLDAVVVLCDFADSLLFGRHDQMPHFPPPRQTEKRYAAHDSVFFHHLLQDGATYFAAVSGDQFTLNFTIEPTVANLPDPMAFYGDDPANCEQPVLLAAHALAQLDSLIDFTAFDTVILIHAGAGEESDANNDSPEQIMSTYLSPEDFAEAFAEGVLETPYIDVADDFPPDSGVDQVLILPETEYQDPLDPSDSSSGKTGSLGVYCFVTGLRLGMIPLFGYSTPNPQASIGIGEFGLMGYGLYAGGGWLPPHPCAFNKMLMGWLDPVRVDPGQAAPVMLTPSADPTAAYAAARVEITGQEYWLVEYRLKDPDGNRWWTLPGDSNGNYVRDFWDADSPGGDGVPGPDAVFDPENDTREWLTGSEFDFFMGESFTPLSEVQGSGSGLFIWHVDEGVIRDLFRGRVELANGDPERKGVDLEEADGIQDFDSYTPSEFILGSYDDSFRGEGADEFGPDTVPDTRTAGGAWTGVLFDQISTVVIDSTGGQNGSVVYRDTMVFYCRLDGSAAGQPALAGALRLDGVDLSGSHLLAAELDAEPDGLLEIVLTGQAGEIFALEPDLTGHAQRSGPKDVEPLAIGTDAEGVPVPWNSPAAAGDLDGDGRLEIVVTALGGLYAFNGEDGSEIDGDGDEFDRGLLANLDRCHLPAVLLPLVDDALYNPATEVVACVVDSAAAGARLRFLAADGASAFPDLVLPAVTVPSPPLLWGEILAVAATATEGQGFFLVLISWTPETSPPEILAWIPLASEPGPLSLAGGVFAADAVAEAPPAPYLVVTGVDGTAEMIQWDGTGLAGRSPWLPVVRLTSSPAPNPSFPADPPGLAKATPPSDFQPSGLAFVGNGVFGLASPTGSYLPGWPRRPLPVVLPAEATVAPSALRFDGRVLCQSRDGRLFLYEESGSLVPGWPLAGPSSTAGTPLVADLSSDGDLDLVACGTSHRISGVDAETGLLESTAVAGVSVWTGVGRESQLPTGIVEGWGMWRGTPWRNPGRSRVLPFYRGQELLVSDSHFCFPNPLTSDVLYVQAVVSSVCQVRVLIYNLEGELVTTVPPRDIVGREPFTIKVPLDWVASGLYLCRLLVEDQGGNQARSVVPFAVAR